MIEATNGSGLSGITGKSAKQGKSNMFSKLLAMLEKNADASGKGKGLQLNATGKGKTLNITTDKGDTLVEGKNKLMLAATLKGKSESGETLAEETATPLFSANIIIDSANQQSKKGSEAGKVHVLITDQKGEAKGESQGNSGLKQPLQAEKAILQDGKTAQAPDAKLAEHSADKIASSQQTEAKLDPASTLASQTDSKAMTSALNKGDFEQLLMAADKSQPVKQFVKTEAGIQTQQANQNGAAVNPQAAAITGEQKVASPLLSEGQQITTANQTDHALGEKPEMKQKSDAGNALAGAQLQQGKPVQLQQGQNSVQTGNAPAAVQINSAEASLADSGSGSSSDKGGQDARNLSAMSGDAKAMNSSSSTNSNFQSYLTGKTAPTMSVFDSMKHIAQSASNGQTKLEIQLDPANLGKIQITLQTDAAKQLQVHMVVDQSATRASIEQQLPILRNALAQQGFDLSGFSMDSNGQQGASAENQHRGSGNNSAGSADNSTTLTSNHASEQPSGRTADGGLSIHV